MQAISLKLQGVWCELEFKNGFKHQSPRNRQANEKTRGLNRNNNQRLQCALYHCLCSLQKSAEYYKLPFTGGQPEKLGSISKGSQCTIYELKS